MVLARASLASTLLALCWVAFALSGCLLSQEDRVLTYLHDRPPRIMEELPTLTPANRLIVVNDCRKLEFGFSAEDPDIDDLLQVRWYVDYPRVPVSNQDFDQVLARSGKAQRNDQGSLTVDLASGLALPLNELQLQGFHIVEAVLFDYQLGANRQPLPIPAPDGGILSPSYAVTYAWAVDMRTMCPLP